MTDEAAVQEEKKTSEITTPIAPPAKTQAAAGVVYVAIAGEELPQDIKEVDRKKYTGFVQEVFNQVTADKKITAGPRPQGVNALEVTLSTGLFYGIECRFSKDTPEVRALGNALVYELAAIAEVQYHGIHNDKNVSDVKIVFGRKTIDKLSLKIPEIAQAIVSALGKP
jgi:hypothetical protein